MDVPLRFQSEQVNVEISRCILLDASQLGYKKRALACCTFRRAAVFSRQPPLRLSIHLLAQTHNHLWNNFFEYLFLTVSLPQWLKSFGFLIVVAITCHTTWLKGENATTVIHSTSVAPPWKVNYASESFTHAVKSPKYRMVAKNMYSIPVKSSCVERRKSWCGFPCLVEKHHMVQLLVDIPNMARLFTSDASMCIMKWSLERFIRTTTASTYAMKERNRIITITKLLLWDMWSREDVIITAKTFDDLFAYMNSVTLRVCTGIYASVVGSWIWAWVVFLKSSQWDMLWIMAEANLFLTLGKENEDRVAVRVFRIVGSGGSGMCKVRIVVL